MPFGLLTLVGPWNHVLDEGSKLNTFEAARGDKLATRPSAKLVGHMFIIKLTN